MNNRAPVRAGPVLAIMPAMRSLLDQSDAGRTVQITGTGLKMLTATEKTALIYPYRRLKRVRDLLGRKFGRLLVLFFAGVVAKNKIGWLCRCDCGVLRVLPSGALLSGNTKSCGCGKIENMVGKRYGKLVVLRRIPTIANEKPTCECLCDCGNTLVVPTWKLPKKRISSCGCVKRIDGSSLLDITGLVFGRLTVLRIDKERSKKEYGRTETYWVCSCSCGNETSVIVSGLRSGGTKSCGCLKHEQPGRIALPNNESRKNALLHTYRKNARKRSQVFELSRAKFLSLVAMNCVYCGAAPAQEIGQNEKGPRFYYNGIDRVDNSLGYTSDNCVPCCKWCNYAKQAMSRDDFFAHALKIVEHSNLRRFGIDDDQ